ncbi:MAG: hypothetical protein ACE5H4_03510 [Candidatus Thorarchaeota archaeon]
MERNRIQLKSQDWTAREVVYFSVSLIFGFVGLGVVFALVLRTLHTGSSLSEIESIGLLADIPALIAYFYIFPERVRDMRRARISIESELVNTFLPLSSQLRKHSVLVPRFFRDGGPLWIDYQKEYVYRDSEDTQVYDAVKESPLILLIAEAGKGKTTLASLTGIEALKRSVFDKVYYERAPFSAEFSDVGLNRTVGSRLAHISKLMDAHPTYSKKRALVILDDIHLFSKKQVESIGSNLHLFEDRVGVLMIARPRTPFVNEEIEDYANTLLQSSTFADKTKGPYQYGSLDKDADWILQAIERRISHKTVESIVRWYVGQLGLKERIAKDFIQSVAETADRNLTLLSLLLRRIDTDRANLASDLDICQAAEDYLNDLRNRCVASIIDKERSFLPDDVSYVFNRITEVLFTFSKMEVYLPQTHLLSFSEINGSERTIAGHIINYLVDCGELREATLGSRRFNLFSNPTVANVVSVCNRQKAIADGTSDEEYSKRIDDMTVELVKSLVGFEVIGPLYSILSYCQENDMVLPRLFEFLKSEGAVMLVDLVKGWHRSYRLITLLEELISSKTILPMICQKLSEDKDGWTLLKAIADSNELLENKDILNAIESSAPAIAQSIEVSDNPKEIIRAIIPIDKLRSSSYIVKAVSRAAKKRYASLRNYW